MNQRAKQIMAGVMLVGGVGIWVPQLLGAGKPSKPMNTDEFPAEFEADPEGMPEPETEVVETSTPVTDDRPEKDAEPAAREGGALEKLLAAKGGSGRSLSDLSAMWSDNSDEGSNGNSEGSAGSVANPVSLPLPEESFADPLQDFLSANELSGILIGGEKRMVSFGSYLFHEGDTIFGGEAKIVEVSDRFVTLSYRDEQTRVALPPFRARASKPQITDGESLPEEEPIEEEGVEIPSIELPTTE